MTPLSLVPSDHAALWTPALKVTDIKGQVLPYIAEMTALMHAREGAGLAAPQVGLSLAFFIVTDGANGSLVIINPEIVHRGKEQVTEMEGCLSFPGQEVLVTRSRLLTVRFTDEDGAECVRKLKDWAATLFAHEHDHTMGVCILPQPFGLERLVTAPLSS